MAQKKTVTVNRGRANNPMFASGPVDDLRMADPAASQDVNAQIMAEAQYQGVKDAGNMRAQQGGGPRDLAGLFAGQGDTGGVRTAGAAVGATKVNTRNKVRRNFEEIYKKGEAGVDQVIEETKAAIMAGFDQTADRRFVQDSRISEEMAQSVIPPKDLYRDANGQIDLMKYYQDLNANKDAFLANVDAGRINEMAGELTEALGLSHAPSSTIPSQGPSGGMITQNTIDGPQGQAQQTTVDTPTAQATDIQAQGPAGEAGSSASVSGMQSSTMESPMQSMGGIDVRNEDTRKQEFMSKNAELIGQLAANDPKRLKEIMDLDEGFSVSDDDLLKFISQKESTEARQRATDAQREFNNIYRFLNSATSGATAQGKSIEQAKDVSVELGDLAETNTQLSQGYTGDKRNDFMLQSAYKRLSQKTKDHPAWKVWAKDELMFPNGVDPLDKSLDNDPDAIFIRNSIMKNQQAVADNNGRIISLVGALDAYNSTAKTHGDVAGRAGKFAGIQPQPAPEPIRPPVTPEDTSDVDAWLTESGF